VRKKARLESEPFPEMVTSPVNGWACFVGVMTVITRHGQQTDNEPCDGELTVWYVNISILGSRRLGAAGNLRSDCMCMGPEDLLVPRGGRAATLLWSPRGRWTRAAGRKYILENVLKRTISRHRELFCPPKNPLKLLQCALDILQLFNFCQ